eukprot:9469667-Pyramimonas_sp.AAC.1
MCHCMCHTHGPRVRDPYCLTVSLSHCLTVSRAGPWDAAAGAARGAGAELRRGLQRRGDPRRLRAPHPRLHQRRPAALRAPRRAQVRPPREPPP